MFTSKNGMKKAGSKFVTDRYDREHEGEEQEHAEKPADHKALSRTNSFGESNKSQPSAENGQEHENEEGKESPEQVVAEHGPATTIHIHHDHVAGKHHVTSTHEDGHVHESDHATAAEAHEHAKKLGGGEEAHENPDEATGGQEGNTSGDMSAFGLGSQTV